MHEIITTKSLTKIYRSAMGAGEVKALDSIDLSVTAGEFIGIMGPSGSGKKIPLLGCAPQGGVVVFWVAGCKCNPAAYKPPRRFAPPLPGGELKPRLSKVLTRTGGKLMHEIITTKSLTKIYRSAMGAGEVKALDSINLSVTAGEFIGIMGPSGSGKKIPLLGCAPQAAHRVPAGRGGRLLGCRL